MSLVKTRIPDGNLSFKTTFILFEDLIQCIKQLKTIHSFTESIA